MNFLDYRAFQQGCAAARGEELLQFSKCQFYGEAWPGDTLTYHATAHSIQDDGAMASVTSHVNGTLHARDSESVGLTLHILGGPGREIIRAKAEGFGVRGQSPLEGHCIVREQAMVEPA